jgi:hypothetical protein
VAGRDIFFDGDRTRAVLLQIEGGVKLMRFSEEARSSSSGPTAHVMRYS